MKNTAARYFLSFLFVAVAMLAKAQPTKVYTSLQEARANPDLVYKLVLRKNKLKEVPEEIFLFKNIVYLDISKNRLSDLPAWFAELTNLEELYVTRNKFTHVPLPVFSLVKLRILVMDRNPIEIVSPEIKNLTALEMLNFWDTELADLPDTISALKNLKRLDLRNTLIYKDELSHYQKLLPNTEIQVTNGCDCKRQK